MYGLYELTGEVKDRAIKCDRTLRDIHLRVGRLGRTSGRQFGLLLAAHRAHEQHLHRVESQLQALTAELPPRPGELTKFETLTPLPAQLTKIESRLKPLAKLRGHVSRLGTQLARVESQLGDLAALVGQAGKAEIRHNDRTALPEQLAQLERRLDALMKLPEHVEAEPGTRASLPAQLARVESQLEDLAVLPGHAEQFQAQLDTLAPLPAQVAQVETELGDITELARQVEAKVGELAELAVRVDESAGLSARLDRFEAGVNRLQGQVIQVEGVVRQNSRTLDTIVELLRRRQPKTRREELEPPF